MRKIGVVGLCLAFSLAFSSCFNPSDFPVIGWDQDGNPTQVLVSEKEYTSRTTATASAVQDSTLSVLEKRERDGSLNPWALRTVAVGIGIVTEIGVGSIAKVGASPKFRLIFTNSTDPTTP